MQPYYHSCHQWQFDLCTYCCRIQFSTYMSWQILKGQKRCLKRLGKAGVHSWSWLIYGFLIHHCDSMILWRSNISVISSFFLISLFSAHDSQLQHVNSQHSSYKHTNKHNIQRFYSNTPPPTPTKQQSPDLAQFDYHVFGLSEELFEMIIGKLWRGQRGRTSLKKGTLKIFSWLNKKAGAMCARGAL